jgi:predicted RecB family nuclease
LFGDLIKKDIQYFIFYNSHLEPTKVKAGSYKSDAQKIIDELLRFKLDNSVPKFFRIKECNFCKYKDLCYDELKKKDCISLLGGANTKIVERFNNKGLFTINQLSYTFSPRKNDKRYYPELKALSLREGKIYIWNIPEINHSDIEIFIDIESLPDENFTYLIGLLVRNSTIEQYYSFWINSKSETLSLFSQFRQ